MDWTHRIRLRNLQILLSLSQTNNLSHSAQALHTTQPGLSKWLKELEADIGLPLFERHARGLRPTSFGQALIAHAHRIDAHLNIARDDMASMAQGSSGIVRIGTIGTASASTVPMAVMRLLKRMPDARVRLMEGLMDKLMWELENGDLDVVVGRSTPGYESQNIRSESLYTEPLHFVARPGHPIFARRKPTWEHVMDYPWLIWPTGTPIRIALEAAMHAEGKPMPRAFIESNSLTINLTLLNNSDMISFASHRTADRYSRMNVMKVVRLPFSGVASAVMYWRADVIGRTAVDATLAAVRHVVRHPSEAPGT